MTKKEREQIEEMARKYGGASEMVHPEEVVADLTTILEANEGLEDE